MAEHNESKRPTVAPIVETVVWLLGVALTIRWGFDPGFVMYPELYTYPYFEVLIICVQMVS